jgi:hypothetical protein
MILFPSAFERLAAHREGDHTQCSCQGNIGRTRSKLSQAICIGLQSTGDPRSGTSWPINRTYSNPSGGSHRNLALGFKKLCLFINLVLPRQYSMGRGFYLLYTLLSRPGNGAERVEAVVNLPRRRTAMVTHNAVRFSVWAGRCCPMVRPSNPQRDEGSPEPEW